MRELMKTNVYDVGETVLIVGSCLPQMEPEGFARLCEGADSVFELCLEQTHVNMAITKISAKDTTMPAIATQLATFPSALRA